MCFSAQASFTAAAALAFIAALSLKKVRTNPERMLAMSPLFFAIQQAIEGIVWVTINQGDTTSLLHRASIYGFLAFAYILWPLWVPTTVYLLERNAVRKKIALGLIGIGTLVGAAGIVALAIGGYTANALCSHIVYLYSPTVPYFAQESLHILQYLLLVLYALVIPGSMFISTVPSMWILGGLIALGFIAAQLSYAFAFGSVWCFFGALSSITVYYILSKRHTH